ncbi:DUF2799 domain-containing protein [Pseudobdellovibrio exovorus]|uniref:DUF2799 domain-containing protein n=1 Tax=Pseudobdellovibrio exovorus JSS TaxID=1184267 RepID=M4VBY0_9BACT|nr:DUF2799 domain-containing protein [Pseudobdellovibrio exovorus]AGH95970.1 hypothetical protein A11Q_1754 [Pseudobdellovibrio exovorus JSS]
MNKKKIVSILLLVVVGLSLSSCASYFKRKDCESTNWFDYGQKVALDGRRLTGDQFILECRQAEANISDSDLDRGFKSGLAKYCQPETIYQVGRNGQFFSSEMCIGENLTLLRTRHLEGVTAYCQKSNGYSAGSAGHPYNKICPSGLEPEFLKEFNRGRKRYLNVMITENDRQISSLEREISSAESELRLRRLEMQRYQLSASQNEQAMERYNSLSSQVRNLEYTVSNKRSEQNKLREQNRQLQVEVVRTEY